MQTTRIVIYAIFGLIFLAGGVGMWYLGVNVPKDQTAFGYAVIGLILVVACFGCLAAIGTEQPPAGRH